MSYSKMRWFLLPALLATVLFGSLYAQGVYTVSTGISAGSSGGNMVVAWTAGDPTWTPIEGTVGEMAAGGLVHVAVPAGGADPAGTWTIAVYLKNPYDLNEAYSFINMELHARKAANGDMSTTAGWVTETLYAVGNTVKPTVANGHFYRCSAAGTSGAAEPTWPTASGGTVPDGTVTWTEFGPGTERAALTLAVDTTTALVSVDHPDGIYDLLNPDKGYVVFSVTSVDGLAGIVETVGETKTLKAVQTASLATHRIFAIGIMEGSFYTKKVSVPANLSPSFYVEVRGR